MVENIYDSNIIELHETGTFDVIEIFKGLMSFFVKKELIDSTFIIRYDMSEQKNILSTQRKTFLDMNKIIALITLDMKDFFSVSKSILYKGIYDVNIGIDEDKVNNMLGQYTENLKAQLESLNKSKPTRIEVQNRVIPNVSLRKMYLEPVKIKNERLTFFKSGKNIQYLDKLEKNFTNEMNSRIKRAKNNNIKNICDLRTLRYSDETNSPKVKMSMFEIKDKIEEKSNMFRRKNSQAFNKRADYYEILDDFLKKQKPEKEKVLNELNRKVKFGEFFIITLLLYLITIGLIIMSKVDISVNSPELKNLLITSGVLGIAYIISTIIVFKIENHHIKKMIDKYIDFVNVYNNQLQISSDAELKRLINTYELIILNGDIEYYKEE